MIHTRFAFLLLALSFVPGSAAPLTREAAIQHLKDTGQFDSLVSAITGARYAAKPADSTTALAQNPAQGINSTFTPEGLTFTVRSAGFQPAVSPSSSRQGGETPPASQYAVASQAGSSAIQQTGSLRYKAVSEATHTVAWHWASLGYGAEQIPVPPGELKVTGQRVELTRGAFPTPSSALRVPHLVEWFHNTPSGLEHGFTLAEQPAANPRAEPLRLVFSVTGDLSPQADAAGQKLLLRDAAGRTVLAYEKLKVWDATGAELPATMQVANGQVTLAVTETTARYPITIDPTFAQQAYLKAGNTAANDFFGYAVAMSGDTVVVGADGEDGGATDSGAAYVFVRSGTT